MAGINTAFNVGRGRSWGPEPRGPQGASLSSSLARSSRLAGAYVYLSLFPVIARDPTPQPPPAEGSLLFLRSAIRQIAIDTGDPLFPFFSSLFPLVSFSLHRSLESPLLFVPPPAPPPSPLLNLRQRQKASSFTLARGIMLTRSYHALSLFISFSLANRSFGTHSIDADRRLSDRAADNADRYRRVRTCGDFRGFAQRDDAG